MCILELVRSNTDCPPAKRVAHIQRASRHNGGAGRHTDSTPVWAVLAPRCTLVQAHHRPKPGGRLSRRPGYISSMHTTVAVACRRWHAGGRLASSLRKLSSLQPPQIVVGRMKTLHPQIVHFALHPHILTVADHAK